MAALQLIDIVKRYDNGYEAVKGVSLSIRDGEFVVFVGPSGCGKTTTLRMIAGLENISSGELLFDGQRMNDCAPRDRDVGMVFQNYALYPHMTVSENIAFPLVIRGESRQFIRERVEEVARLLGLSEQLSRKPKQLSGGQRQRVALGRAIVRRPRVFLFDEPLSNLDAQLRVQMRAEILELQRSLGTTAVYVTHDQMEAMTMGDRIVVMQGGIVQQTASPEEVYNNPENRFVAGFLGSPSMNFFTGHIARDSGLVFRERDGVVVRLDERLFRATPPPDGTAAVLGVRPEHIVPVRNNEPEQSVFTAPVSLVEYLGHEVLVHFSTGGVGKISRVGSSNSAVAEGESLAFAIDTRRVCLFDAAGQRL